MTIHDAVKEAFDPTDDTFIAIVEAEDGTMPFIFRGTKELLLDMLKELNDKLLAQIEANF